MAYAAYIHVVLCGVTKLHAMHSVLPHASRAQKFMQQGGCLESVLSILGPT
jgi:hypothetical protein